MLLPVFENCEYLLTVSIATTVGAIVLFLLTIVE